MNLPFCLHCVAFRSISPYPRLFTNGISLINDAFGLLAVVVVWFENSGPYRLLWVFEFESEVICRNSLMGTISSSSPSRLRWLIVWAFSVYALLNVLAIYSPLCCLGIEFCLKLKLNALRLWFAGAVPIGLGDVYLDYSWSVNASNELLIDLKLLVMLL
mgnify:CR=1 FL=1